MNPIGRPWKMRALGLAALVSLAGCTVSGEGYVGAVYEPAGYEYGGWETGYYVAPPRHGHRDDRYDRRDEHRAEVRHVEPVPAPQPSSRYAYRPAPSSRPAPSIPTRPAPPGHQKTPPGQEKKHH